MLMKADCADYDPLTHTLTRVNRRRKSEALEIHVPGWEENPGLNQYAGVELIWGATSRLRDTRAYFTFVSTAVFKPHHPPLVLQCR